MDEDRNCTTCLSESVPMDEWPCSNCDSRMLNKWEPKKNDEDIDLWEI